MNTCIDKYSWFWDFSNSGGLEHVQIFHKECKKMILLDVIKDREAVIQILKYFGM